MRFERAKLKCSDSKPEKLILVVHGVGDPVPGDTLSLFARSLAESEQPLIEQQEVIWLSEKSESQNPDHINTFPAHQRRLGFEKRSLDLCEVFWGDLSRVRRGWLGVVDGLFQILFGIRYAAYVAADQPGAAAHWLKRLGLMSSRILHGPVLAVTFFLAILIAAVCGTQLLWPESYKAAIWTQVVLSGCCMVALGFANVGSRLTRSRVVERFWFWVNVTVMFVAGLMFIKAFWMDHHYPELIHTCPIHPGLLWYCRVLLVLLGLLWFIEIQVLFGLAACWFLALTHPKAYNPALHVGFLLPALAVGIWGQALPMFWISAKEGINTLAELPEFAAVFDDAIPFLGVQLMMMLVIMIAGAMTVLRYFRWRQKHTIDSYRSGKRAPRLIINGGLQVVLAACTAIGVCMVSVLCVIQLLGYSYTDFWIGQAMKEVNKYAVSVIVPLGGLLFLLIPKLRPGFDMILDVVNHFYFRPTNMQDALDDDDEFDILETTFENGRLFFSRRDSLHLRMKRILTYYRDKYDHHPELVIISHSQGTMVAIEVLNDDDLAWLNNSFSSVTLVTMGSPLTHLYQHYFGHVYPELDQPFWCSLRRRVNAWVNICRIDDFVGTDVNFPTQELKEADTADLSFYTPITYENHAVGPRGHTSYWSDREVLSILRKYIFAVPKEEEQQVRKSA